LTSERIVGLQYSQYLKMTENREFLASAAVKMAEAMGARAIVVITRRGVMAGCVTNCRPFRSTIYAFTNDGRACRQMALNRGVVPHKIACSKDPDKTIAASLEVMKTRNGFQSGEKVVLISNVIAGSGADTIQIRRIP